MLAFNIYQWYWNWGSRLPPVHVKVPHSNEGTEKEGNRAYFQDLQGLCQDLGNDGSPGESCNCWQSPHSWKRVKVPAKIKVENLQITRIRIQGTLRTWITSSRHRTGLDLQDDFELVGERESGAGTWHSRLETCPQILKGQQNQEVCCIN